MLTSKKVIIVVPTYNERENIADLLREILSLRLEADLSVLVVDDNSPDGTGDLIQDLGEKDPRIRLISRKEAKGRGTAAIKGLEAALSLAPDYVIEMDADGSHQPRYIPSLLLAAEEGDLVLGSRFTPGGRDTDRGFVRRIITFLVRRFIRRLYGLAVEDVSSGFRCFRKHVLEKIGLDSLISTGPSEVLEILYKAHLEGFSIREVPIIFLDRKRGKTKLTLFTLLETLFMAIKFKMLYRR